jgi:hypothetical protein
LVLLYAVAFVLLIACANIANLLLAARLRDRKRLRQNSSGRQPPAHNSAIADGESLSFVYRRTLGLVLSLWLTKLLIAISPANTPRLDQIRPDARLIIFAVLLAVVPAYLRFGSGAAGISRGSGRRLEDWLAW